jgi:long-subunit acyl-CoA synthetase (AMP-forming)
MAEVNALHQVGPQTPGGRMVSFLPSAHIADRWSSQYNGIVHGHELTYAADGRQVLAVAAQVHPTVFGSVPRIWEKLKSALEAGFANEQDETRREAIAKGLEASLAKVRAEQAGEEVPEAVATGAALADEHIFSKVREMIGLDQVEWFIAGAAATPPAVLEFFMAIGIPICELWGMSETTAVMTLNPASRIRIGTVGPPLPTAEVRLAEDGEILGRGPMVMKGYRNMPEQTAEAIDSEGWLHTGDIGEFDEEGYLKIVDRKKELIINAAGKNMSPANIEGKIKTSSELIGQAIAIGDGRPYNVALIVLDPDGAAAFAAQKGLDDASTAALAANDDALNEVAAGVERANAQLSRVEQIKKFRVLPVDWEPGGDELTPTMKLKRKPIGEKYAAEIEALYAD